ncbi:hypothetical protein [Companilactobacillus jidongensis]|uniref:hypothetical protein n=1 Tax=Companilactobacillus jidongensis TaxID=2486006 RepID=UPI000F7A94BA|nr:hypothetical protein [Companilactobacillus jidongensis]
MKQEKVFDLFILDSIHFASVRTFQNLKLHDKFQTTINAESCSFKIIETGQVDNFNKQTIAPYQTVLLSDTQANKFMIIEPC